MAWDASRPVPWRRLVREWLIYAAIMAALFLLFFRDDSMLGILAGLLVSGPLYLAFGYVLAKFGYQRKTLRDARAGCRHRPFGTIRQRPHRAGTPQAGADAAYRRRQLAARAAIASDDRGALR